MVYIAKTNIFIRFILVDHTDTCIISYSKSYSIVLRHVRSLTNQGIMLCLCSVIYQVTTSTMAGFQHDLKTTFLQAFPKGKLQGEVKKVFN
jgi:ABC-type lipoprotein release transport system permease subunit